MIKTVLKVASAALAGVVVGKIIVDKFQSEPDLTLKKKVVPEEKPNLIVLDELGTRTRLFGARTGNSIWNLYVGDKLKDGKNTIVFTPQIEKISSSFVQGFTKQYIDELGYDEFKKNIEVVFLNTECGEKLKEEFWDNLVG